MLNITDLNKAYKGMKVVNSVNLNVENGSVFGVFGNENSGKTTLLRLIAGVVKKDSGEIVLDGKQIKGKNTNLVYLPEITSFHEDVTVYEELKLLLKLKNISKKEIDKKIDSYLKDFELTKAKTKKIKNLAIKDIQKLRLLSLLIGKSDLVLIDEPYKNFGELGIEEFIKIINKLKDSNKIVIIASENSNYVENICDNVGLMKNGVLKNCGNLKDKVKSTLGEEVFIKVNNPSDKINFIESLLSVKKLLEVREDGIVVSLSYENNSEDLIKDLFNKGINFSEIHQVKKKIEDIYYEEFRKDLV